MIAFSARWVESDLVPAASRHEGPQHDLNTAGTGAARMARIVGWVRGGQPARTAVGAARHRAVHQVLEGGRIFSDPLAWQILGEDPGPTVEAAQQDPHSRRLRLFIAARHRFAEDCLVSAVDCGTRQVVVLGAGLDTFAYRAPRAGLVAFEVDHPDTGEWKRRRLRESGIGVPAAPLGPTTLGRARSHT